MDQVGGFTSTPIKLAALIDTKTRARVKGGAWRAHYRSALVALVLVLGGSAAAAASELRHQAHYLSIVPSTHFQYNEGRQYSKLEEQELGQLQQAAYAAAHPQARSLAPAEPKREQEPAAGSSHIYKRSSALISSSPGAELQRRHQHPSLRRRMMSEISTSNSIIQSRWLAPPQPQQAQEAEELAGGELEAQQSELLRQKQHIQYHDQWPSTAGRCHKRTLNFCAQVLPFNTTTFPNIIGDTNRFEVKRSLPFFGFLAKSSCNKRLDELLCLLLEPPCSAHSGLALPPCKKFCRLALEGCNEYIPATLALSSVFDCRQYPDSSDPHVCVNLAQGSSCAPDEFKCPDKTCIPRNWLCDGVRDCVFAADEANCTAGAGQVETSVCSTEEFKCDGKCVPKAWKCDGERDCLDGSDEDQSCELKPRCGQDRFRCADGNGCIPKRWVCDGKAECRDGSDETNCESRDCSESDFKCDNGICIPKIWRCDRQFDCKDGSDERACVYPSRATTSTSTSAPTTSGELASSKVYLNASYALATAKPEEEPTAAPEPATTSEQSAEDSMRIVSDVSRIIQQESSASVAAESPTTTAQPVRVQQELKKYDYDLIQSSSARPRPAAELPAPSVQPDPQLPTQIDFVPQPQPELPRASARVPIYRSLFKTLKGGERPPRVGLNQRQLVAVARRRRQQVAEPRTLAEQQQVLQGAQRVAAVGAHGTVASYLQLLNGGRHAYRPQQQQQQH